MKWKIIFRVSRESSSPYSMKSSGEGELTAENFEEMTEEIKRWLDNNGKVEILEVEEL